MIEKISIHKVDAPDVIKSHFDYRLGSYEKYIERSKTQFHLLNYVFKDSLELLQMSVIEKQDLLHQKKWFHYGLNCISEACRLSHFNDQEKDAQIDESGAFKIKIENLKQFEDFIKLLNGLYMSIIARDLEKQKYIATAPLSFYGINVEADTYFICMVKLLKEYFSTKIFNEELYSKLKIDFAKIKSTVKPDPKSKYRIYYINKYMSAFKSLVEDKEKEFNQNLILALEAHKEVWSQKKALNRGGTPLCRENEGFLSWGCTALAAMAYDKGWKLEVESDYMPSFMVDGSINK